MRILWPLVALAWLGGCDACAPKPPAGGWLLDASIVVAAGTDVDCRVGSCAHQSETDLASFSGATYLIHRTARSGLLSPNSSLRVYRAVDGGSFSLASIILPPPGTDLRSPHFAVGPSSLFVVALSRLPVASLRDTNVNTETVVTSSADGTSWTPLAAVTPTGFGLWRPKPHDGGFLAAATQDGDLGVQLFTSADGLIWSAGAQLPLDAGDTPVDTELSFLPSGDALALVRLDGTDAELEGEVGRLRSAVCTAPPQLSTFACSLLDGERLDTAASFFFGGRLFEIARRHQLGASLKRTAVFEIAGVSGGGAPGVAFLQELPSACDTGSAGVVFASADQALVSWYSSDLSTDAGWSACRGGPTDVWLGQVDLTRL